MVLFTFLNFSAGVWKWEAHETLRRGLHITGHQVLGADGGGQRGVDVVRPRPRPRPAPLLLRRLAVLRRGGRVAGPRAGRGGLQIFLISCANIFALLQLSPGPGRGRSRSLGGRGPDPPRPRPPGTASWRSPAWPDTSSSAGSRTRTAADPRALKILSNQGQEIFFNGTNIFLACDRNVRKYMYI